MAESGRRKAEGRRQKAGGRRHGREAGGREGPWVRLCRPPCGKAMPAKPTQRSEIRGGEVEVLLTDFDDGLVAVHSMEAHGDEDISNG